MINVDLFKKLKLVCKKTFSMDSVFKAFLVYPSTKMFVLKWYELIVQLQISQ